MELKLEIYGSLCSTSIFTINGLAANEFEFGKSYDANPDEAEEYGCGNRKFKRIASTEKVLTKYNISEEEYIKIAEQLEDKLSFGNCGWCV